MDAFVRTCCGKPPASRDFKRHAKHYKNPLGLPHFANSNDGFICENGWTVDISACSPGHREVSSVWVASWAESSQLRHSPTERSDMNMGHPKDQIFILFWMRRLIGVPTRILKFKYVRPWPGRVIGHRSQGLLSLQRSSSNGPTTFSWSCMDMFPSIKSP